MEAFFSPPPQAGSPRGPFPTFPSSFFPQPCVSPLCRLPALTPGDPIAGGEGTGGTGTSLLPHCPPTTQRMCSPPPYPTLAQRPPKAPHILEHRWGQAFAPCSYKHPPHQPLPPTPLRTPQPPGPLCPAEHPHSSPRTGMKPPPCVRAQADSSRNKTSERLAWFLGDVEQSPARWKPAGISPSCSPAGRFPAAGSARWCCAHAQRPQTRPRHPKNR